MMSYNKRIDKLKLKQHFDSYKSATEALKKRCAEIQLENERIVQR